MSTPLIQWYPGHIAKAEKELAKQLAKIDLVIEVRDARIPLSTSHPHLQRWIKEKQHLLVINRLDMITIDAKETWHKWFRQNNQIPLWCNAKEGKGIKHILQEAINSGKEFNQRRVSRGMLKRPVRALTLGFPNVGKSALINRLVGKKVVQSARRAGVTRSLRWVRMGQELDLLDAPGVLPPRLNDQNSAIRLAICDDIGEAAYDVESIAIEFIKIIHNSIAITSNKSNLDLFRRRYGIAIPKEESEIYNWLIEIAKSHTSGSTERMSQRILDDFRKNILGLIPLEFPQ